MSTIRKHTVSSIIACALTVVLVCGLSPALAFATPLDELQAQANAALAQLDALQADLDEASNNYAEAVAEHDAAVKKMEEATKRIEEATKRIDELQTQLGTRARSMYRNGVTTFIDIILGSSTFKEFANNWDLLDQMNEKDANMVHETKQLRQEIVEQKKELERQEIIAAEKEAEAKEVVEEAEALMANMQATYNSLSAEVAAIVASEYSARNLANNSDYSSYMPAADDGTIVGRAMSYVGNGEYVFGACEPGYFDCSGFVSYCLTGSYTRLGNTYTFLGWTEVDDPQPGDICVNEGHCGIYVGNGMMAHAASPSEGIIVSAVQSGMSYHRY